MSYAGPTKTRAASAPPSASAGSRAAPPRRQEGRNAGTSDNGTDWQQLALFGAGLAVGIALGAGIALVTAPQAGEETRADIRRKARRATRMLGRRSRDAWLDLRDELRGATQALSRRKARRATERARREELARESVVD
jgi:gas vesicle protein